MAEELQNLLERIKQDGVEKAEAEAQSIIDEARGRAEDVVRRAEADAKARHEAAEKDAAAFEQRAAVAVRQAARDVILSVGAAVEKLFERILEREVEHALTPEALAGIIQTVLQAYGRSSGGEQRIDILLNPGQKKQIVDLVFAEARAAVRDGVEIKGDESVVAGFRVSVSGSHVEHDFTGAAIADSLAELLRPELARLVKAAAEENS
ncbi:MAG: hypothetical protein JXB13_22665 [Phycisphaerae bacterium]|nr:hypothetical protein [Phycisphaerae bacterium]